MADVFFLVCDGLKGLPDSVNAVFPMATVQTCIVVAGNTVVTLESGWGAVVEAGSGPVVQLAGRCHDLVIAVLTGEVSPDQTLELFRRAFTAAPDAETYQSLRMWLGGQLMREMSEGRFDGRWSSISDGVHEFGKARGWYY